jgi:hypothetical protein
LSWAGGHVSSWDDSWASWLDNWETA